MAGVEIELYRKRNPDGTAKDWAVPVAPASTVLTVFYGRTGSALRQADTPWRRCRDGDPRREAEARVREKTADGYQHLGRFRLADNRRDLTRLAAAPGAGNAGPDATPPPCLYWRWRPRDGDESARRAAVEAACAEAAAKLAAVGWAVPGSRPDDDGRALWAVAAGTARNGVVPLADGNDPAIAFWLLVARRCPDLRLVDDDQRVVRDWPADLSVEPAILEALDLQPMDLDRLLAASGDGDHWFF